MTLTEYLQNAVAELRERADELRTWPLSKWAAETDALADHVERLLERAKVYAAAYEDYQMGAGFGVDAMDDALYSTAQLVSVVTGKAILEGAQP